MLFVVVAVVVVQLSMHTELEGLEVAVVLLQFDTNKLAQLGGRTRWRVCRCAGTLVWVYP